jgi:hypothetical protein
MSVRGWGALWDQVEWNINIMCARCVRGNGWVEIVLLVIRFLLFGFGIFWNGDKIIKLHNIKIMNLRILCSPLQILMLNIIAYSTAQVIIIVAILDNARGYLDYCLCFIIIVVFAVVGRYAERRVFV